jgi:hypothetical protein
MPETHRRHQTQIRSAQELFRVNSTKPRTNFLLLLSLMRESCQIATQVTAKVTMKKPNGLTQQKQSQYSPQDWFWQRNN